MNESLASRLILAVLMLPGLTSTPTLAASPSTPALDRGWTPSSVASPQQGMYINIVKVVAGGPGLLALGMENSMAPPSPSLHVELWASADGLSWHSVALSSDLFPDTAQVNDMVAGPHGIVITGTIQFKGSPGPPPPLFWSSQDGEHWSRSSYAAPDGSSVNLRSLAAGPAGFVALAMEFQKSPPTPDKPPTGPSTVVLTSTDGSTWQQAPGTQSALADLIPSAIVSDGSGFILVGAKTPPPSQSPPPSGTIQNGAVSYTSHDGLTWSGPHLLPVQQPTNQSSVFALFAAQGMLIALGNESGPNQGSQRIWISADGERWQASTWKGNNGAYISTMTSLGGLLVASGVSQDGSTIWTSSDGLHWTQAADERAFGSSPTQHAFLQSVVGFQNGLEAVGGIAPTLSPSCGPPQGATQPAVPPLVAWRWTPQSSQAAAPPPKPSRLDPRTFTLRQADMPAGAATVGGGYIPLCSVPNPSTPPGPNGPTVVPGPFSPLLGTYSAYNSMFVIQYGQGFPAENVRSLTIVAGIAKAARTAVAHAPNYFSTAYGYPGKPKELRVTKRIGTETRLFATHALVDCGEDCAPTAVPAVAVIWRQGRDIGIVVVYGALSNRQNQIDALRFAAAQAAHLRQASTFLTTSMSPGNGR